MAEPSLPPPKGNPWQNVDRMQRHWLTDFGRDPIDGLDAASVQTLRLAFARRHVLEHNGGLVDEAYTRETGEGAIGRRVRITPRSSRRRLWLQRHSRSGWRLLRCRSLGPLSGPLPILFLVSHASLGCTP